MTYLARQQENSPRTADCLRKIDTSSKFLLGLVNDVLDMSKAESGRIELYPEPYTAARFLEYIEAVVRPLCQAKSLDLVLEVAPVREWVPCMDILRVNQIFFNLFSNAVKFTPAGGTITYRLREQLCGDHRLRLEAAVRDTGIGIRPEFQQRIFEPFMQVQSDQNGMQGTGLGLSIVKRLIELMLCSAGELKLDLEKLTEEQKDGIYILPADTPVGVPVKDVLGLDDVVLEFELTANRGDCFSVFGLVREVAVLTGNTPKWPVIGAKEDDAAQAADLIRIGIEAENLCSRFSARVLKNVKIGPSPEWMQQRLEGAGIRAINNVVDVTNFVMSSWPSGQPLKMASTMISIWISSLQKRISRTSKRK